MLEEIAKDAKKYLILCIDDDKRQHNLIRTFLVMNGYDVVFAENGPQALGMVKEVDPDLILLDIMMPEMDGYEVCARLQEDDGTAYIPVIFTTALGEERNQVKALAAGAVDYLVKPYQKKTILEMIEKHIKDKDRWREISREDPTAPVPIERAPQNDNFEKFKAYLVCHFGLGPRDRLALRDLSGPEIYSVCDGLKLGKDRLAQFIAEFTGLSYLPHINPKDINLGVLPGRFCRQNNVLALRDASADLAFVISNPFDIQTMDTLMRFAYRHRRHRMMICEPDKIRWLALDVGSEEDRSDLSGKITLVQEQREDETEEDVTELVEKAPVIKITDHLIAEAIGKGASDIHVEPRETGLGVRYRIDGMLMDQSPIPKNFSAAVISRLKIMSNMDIAERRIPQDGRLRVIYEGRKVDLRVSALPSHHGEKIVMRIMDTSTVSLDFTALGLEGNDLTLFTESIHKPYGILLVTGPTGSGKSTTLYTSLQILNDPRQNIVTVEDPIEQHLHRITQVEVNEKTGLTFPVALRAILRQDPNIIMVGEIRDLETADIAVKASLTGHLVFSTLHTNDCPSTILRLLDMGIDPYLVACSVEMVTAQRLLRRLCPYCRYAADPTEILVHKLGLEIKPDMRFYQAASCDKCGGTGYKGRIAVFEVMAPDERLRRMITGGADIQAMRAHAIENLGMTTLRENALAKAVQGMTSLDEVLRVTLK